MEEFKLKIKSLECALDEARTLVKTRVKETELAWTQRYQKLNEEKNEEIKKHLKKSIDLIDENELLENQLEKLYMLVEEKNLQINYLEEREFEYQNELKRVQFDLHSVDVIGYQYKIHNTQEIGVSCDIIPNDSGNKAVNDKQEIGVMCEIIVKNGNDSEDDDDDDDNNKTVYNVQEIAAKCDDDLNNVSIDGNEVNEILKNNLNGDLKLEIG